MNVILFGPPGAGKGTQSALLADVLKVPHLSTGDILRETADHESPIGRRVASLINQGNLVSDDMILHMVGDRMGWPDCERGCILDGAPRTLNQAERLDVFFDQAGKKVDRLILLEVANEELFRRIRLRAAEQGRKDDSDETLEHRLEVYGLEADSIIDHYRQRGALRTVDGMGTPDEVLQRIRDQVRN